ncbi:MAG: SPFH/Band 7/PHB domain protein [Candidatus Micrarchaeota archaeon]|nr:SPFH/Band 7/PHB domain protein [Candidatus Micrarchaeota archaeon]
MVTTICVIGVALGFVVLMAISVRVLKEYERGVKFTLGKFAGVYGPGLVIVIPFIEEMRITDLRIKTLEVPRQDVITKDNATVGVDAVIYYRVIDPQRVVLEVEDFQHATIRLAQTTLRSIIGDMNLDDCLSKREVINTKLRETLDESTDKWGVKAEAVEIKEIEPPAPIRDAMTKQMAAERTKRAMILEAEGNRQSAILEAEGQKEAEILKSEGQRQAKIILAKGEAESIRIVADAANNYLRGSALTLWQLKALEEVGKAPSTKFVIPMEFTAMLEKLSKNIANPDTNIGQQDNKPQKK